MHNLKERILRKEITVFSPKKRDQAVFTQQEEIKIIAKIAYKATEKYRLIQELERYRV